MVHDRAVDERSLDSALLLAGGATRACAGANARLRAASSVVRKPSAERRSLERQVDKTEKAAQTKVRRVVRDALVQAMSRGGNSFPSRTGRLAAP